MKNAHIVPRTYLESWAIDGIISVEQVHEGKSLEMPVEKVGTRRRFYRRKRADGTDIDDIEWTLGQIESMTSPLLRSFDAAWPLPNEDKLKLATLFAFQHLRTPRWKEEYELRTAEHLEEYDREHPGDYSPAELAEQNEQLASDTHRLVMMISTGTTMSAIVASMHWTLIEFQSPLLATSDHPVVLWFGTASRSPRATEITQIGILECVEIRLPLSPTRAVLMTWSDSPDDEHVRVRGTRDHAANLNAFTVASADRQWFHQPETSPRRTSGNLRPLSLVLVDLPIPPPPPTPRRGVGFS